MATDQQKADFRVKTGEPIPPGGSADDTMFTDAQVEAWIDDPNLTFDEAVVSGWEAKLAQWAGLVNVTDGASARELSDLMEHGQTMINYYNKKAMGTTRSRARVGRIVRL